MCLINNLTCLIFLLFQAKITKYYKHIHLSFCWTPAVKLAVASINQIFYNCAVFVRKNMVLGFICQAPGYAGHPFLFLFISFGYPDSQMLLWVIPPQVQFTRPKCLRKTFESWDTKGAASPAPVSSLWFVSWGPPKATSLNPIEQAVKPFKRTEEGLQCHQRGMLCNLETRMNQDFGPHCHKRRAGVCVRLVRCLNSI